MNGTSMAVKSTPWSVFGVASIAVFLVSIDTTVLFAAFGALRADFPDSAAADLSWVAAERRADASACAYREFHGLFTSIHHVRLARWRHCAFEGDEMT